MDNFANQILERQKHEADCFIAELIKMGIPKSAIATNDFSASLYPRVYVTIPYGVSHGGKSRGYHRWNNRTLSQAVKFYKSYVK